MGHNMLSTTIRHLVALSLLCSYTNAASSPGGIGHETRIKDMNDHKKRINDMEMWRNSFIKYCTKLQSIIDEIKTMEKREENGKINMKKLFEQIDDLLKKRSKCLGSRDMAGTVMHEIKKNFDAE